MGTTGWQFINKKVDLSNLSQICSVQVAPAKWTGRVVLPQPFGDAGRAEEVAFSACHGVPEDVVTVYKITPDMNDRLFSSRHRRPKLDNVTRL